MSASSTSFSAATVPLFGTALVEASAGTGKTHAITTLFVRLLLQRRLDVNRILVVTFTEAATAELRERVRARLVAAAAAFARHAAGDVVDDPELCALAAQSEDVPGDRRRLEAALRDADLAAIFTIHGFCHRVLHDSAFESGAPFEVEILADGQPLRDEVVGDFWASELAGLPPALVRRLREAGLDFGKCQRLVDLALRHPQAPLRPEPSAVADPSPEAFRAAFAAARAAWDGPAVQALLGDMLRMNQSSYRRDKVVGWCEQMAAFLAAPLPDDPHLIEAHEKFCTDQLARGTKGKHAAPDHAFFGACDRLRDAVRAYDDAAAARAVALQHELVRYARAELPRRKERQGVLGYDDLLQQVWRALLGPSGARLARTVRQSYPAALIDEFQDTDPVQYEIFARVYAGEQQHCLLLVGDPKQAIYSFRGADVFAYMQAKAGTSPERRFTMAFNWRSDPGLVDAVNRLYTRVPRPFLLPQIGYPPVDPAPRAAPRLRAVDRDAPLQFVFVRRGDAGRIPWPWLAQRYPDVVAGEVAALLRGGATIDGAPLQPSDVAVLTRTNDQAFGVQAALRRLRIPSVVLGDQSVLESPDAEELQRVLATVVEPANQSALRAALATELLGATASDLARLEDDQRAWEEWVNNFRAWNELWSAKGFVQMFRALMARRGVQPRLLALADGERRMTNVLHLMELLHTAATSLHLGPAGLLHWLAQQRAHAKARPEAAQVRLESDERAVQITTVHRAKGLEYGVVLCPYLWSGMLLHFDDEKVLQYHDPDAGDRLVLEVPRRGDRGRGRALAEHEKLAENLRLLYVALTRARHRCVVFWGAAFEFEKSALGYLLHAPAAAHGETAVAVLQEHLKERGDDWLLEELRALERSAGGSIAVRELTRDAAAVEPLITVDEARAELRCRVPARAIERYWRTSSFSQFASAAGEPEGDEGRERDDALDAALESDADALDVAAPRGAPVVLAAFPRGARAGNFFHDVLEHLDFGAGSEPRADLVQRMLAAYGYPVALWRDAVERALADVLATPLETAGSSVRLSDIAAAQRLNELEFHVPVADGGAAQLTPRALADVFAEHPSAAVPNDYAERLARLRFVPLHGFLKGYIDLLFEHRGRYFVVDYKTTHLGDHREDYSVPRLRHAMVHGHYFLQYHLYSVAVHRHLAHRIAGYDYDRQFGGVLYLFLRGMTPAAARHGVYFERPPRARIEALSARLAGAPR